ncbi:hypothetical protein HIM_12309 [Hirsutella minnesotensis 3608]|uniref:MULE transposase domain-containing protein n=1 Tax=Hirsutella minnesotensis 3608 TaxID=1043627 RepID=A0A0F7ZF05_9HYPO|nr:hypothetical protein HIM_12309 [Hirsutella minnesotensis 3608]
MALAHRTSGLSATESSLILDHHALGSRLSAKEFYNLSRSEGRRTNQEALDLLLTCLEFEDFRVRCFFKYLLDDQGRRTARVLEHLFFCSSEQIRLGRRFVSGFLMQSDATFNTNSLHLPLSVMVGITNTGKTFPLAFAFIKSESAEAFEFVNAQLAELIWLSLRGGEQILQLCEWHAAESIKKRLLDSGRYTKERREDLLRLIWEYIQAPDEEQLGKGRHRLLAEMREPERLYVENNWKGKEPQFARAHTRHYPNLGCNTTQRNESYHVVVKASLNRQLPLQVACQNLAQSLKKLSHKITDDENRSRIDVPRFLDGSAFQQLIGKVPHYVLGKLAPEWEAAKAPRWMRGTVRRTITITESEERGPMIRLLISDELFQCCCPASCLNAEYPTQPIFGIVQPSTPAKPFRRVTGTELDKEREALSASSQPGCPFSCELPSRYSLPCRHWLYEVVVRSWYIPLSLLHPRWLLDGPAVVRHWSMSYGDAAPTDADMSGDQYRDGGRNMVLQSGLEVVQAQAALRGQQAEEFSRLFRLQNERLIANFQRHAQSRSLLPPELPSALQNLELKEFKSHGSTKRRFMTGPEAAERDADREDHASSRSRQELRSSTNQSSTTRLVLADARQPMDGTKRNRKPTAKIMEITAMAAKKGVKKPTKNTENEDPEPRRKRKKVLKQDETQLELQQEPTQDCIAVCSTID